jgi:hypothetical protein
MEDTPLEDMDDELNRIRREADGVDVYKYRRRFRLLKAIGLGAALAGLTWLVMAMVDGGKNPCQRVRDHYCKTDRGGLQCKAYEGILDESLHDAAPEMRANIKSQCESKIQRLKDEDGIELK